MGETCVVPRPAWMVRGACAGSGSRLFLSEYQLDVDRAKAICRSCQVRETCLAYALADPTTKGVWGGTTARELRSEEAPTAASAWMTHPGRRLRRVELGALPDGVPRLVYLLHPMPIPGLGPAGLLPVGKHVATEDELWSAFVDGFPGSRSRPAIFEWWISHREVLNRIAPVTEQWINGSFVTGKMDPNDIDVVSIVDGNLVDSLSPTDLRLLASLTKGHWTCQHWYCDSFLIASFPVTDPGRHLFYQATLAYWESWWGRTRATTTNPSVPKGFVVIQ